MEKMASESTKFHLGDRLTEVLIVIPSFWMFIIGTFFAIAIAEGCSAFVGILMVGYIPPDLWVAAFVSPAVVAPAELTVLITVIAHLRRKNQRLRDAEVALTQDIVSRMRTEAALQQAKEDAEKASRAKSEFLAMMSHEIRTPITGVLGLADLLRHTQLNEEQLKYLDTLANSTKTLLTILNDILDLSKIEAGKILLVNADFSLHQAVADTISMFIATAKDKGLELACHFSNDLPKQVIGDQSRFKQLLFNLVSNAIKFTDCGQVRISLCVRSLNEREATIMVEVQDTGIGIPSNQLLLLFKPFSQLETSTTRRFGGTGLGLVITKRLIEIMGGEIGVESEVGSGTRFWFALPFRVSANLESVAPEPALTRPSPMLRPLRILVAEDNRINQMLLRSMLQKLGHRVDVVENGRIAVEAVVAGDFDAVLMDMQMPEMDGAEATRLIRRLPFPKNMLPIIALTADAMLEHRERYLQAGINELVPKPIDWHVLSNALATHTNGL